MDHGPRDKNSFIRIVPKYISSGISVFNFSNFAVSNYFVDSHMFGDEYSPLFIRIHAKRMPSTMHATHKFLRYILRSLNQF